jgi:hypothetical protein
MTLIMAQHCISGDPYFEKFILSESEPGKVYNVWVSMPGDPPEEYICSCPGFTYRGRCKHQHQIELCKWHELIGPEKQTDEQQAEQICPRCGNKTNKELEDDGQD